jgi:hypothetical protein
MILVLATRPASEPKSGIAPSSTACMANRKLDADQP